MFLFVSFFHKWHFFLCVNSLSIGIAIFVTRMVLIFDYWCWCVWHQMEMCSFFRFSKQWKCFLRDLILRRRVNAIFQIRYIVLLRWRQINSWHILLSILSHRKKNRYQVFLPYVILELKTESLWVSHFAHIATKTVKCLFVGTDFVSASTQCVLREWKHNEK